MALEIGGRADQQATDLADAPGPQGGVGKRRDPQCKIEAAADQIDLLVRQMQVNR